MDSILSIAIDARPLAFPCSGIARYTSNLLREFASQDSPHRIFLYSDRPFDLGFPRPKHWKVRVGKVSIRGLSAAFAQVFFPIWALMDGIEAFWSPSLHLPLLLPPSIRKVITVHDMVWKRFPETAMRNVRFNGALLMPLSLSIADHVIAVSNFTRSEIVALFPNTKNKIRVVYEASGLIARETIGLCPQTSPYFLFVGSNEPRKNLKSLLLAYLEYRKLCPNPIDLVMAGSYQWGDFRVSDFVIINKLDSHVRQIQGADDSQLCALYAHARALVMVSLYEGFGLPLVEAMQWGVPLIASNNSAVAEIAGNAALLVDPLDTVAIAEAFRRLTEDEATRLRLANNAKARGRAFSWKQAATETMALITGTPELQN